MIVIADKQHPNTAFSCIRLSGSKVTLVSPEDYEEINQHRWYAKKSFHCRYACRGIRKNGHISIERMHRRIAQTPAGMVCHHKNKNSLDNRRENLLNMTEFDHVKMHSWR